MLTSLSFVYNTVFCLVILSVINLNTSRSLSVFTLNSLTNRSHKGFRGSLIPVTGGLGGSPSVGII